MKESKMATRIFEKQPEKYHKTYIFVFLIIAIIANIFTLIIFSINILVDCLISVHHVKIIYAGTTTTTGTEVDGS